MQRNGSVGRSVLSIVAIAVGYGFFVYLLYALHARRPAAIALYGSPACLLLLTPPVIDLVIAVRRWYRAFYWSHGPWQSHRFEDRRIRVIEAGETLWFSSRDVHAALGLPRRRSFLRAMPVDEYARQRGIGNALSPSGIRRLAARHRDKRVTRFSSWAEFGVVARWHRGR